jgi:hypothetical protein
VIRRAASQVLTLTPEGTDPRWLGSIGHVSGLTYSYSCPGGADQMQCVLEVPPSFRTPALNPGRMVKIYRGASCVWQGQLNEPVPSVSGWSIAAHGAATMASQFAAYYTTWNLNSPVDQAISRGLPWRNPGIAGGWLEQQPDSASQTVTDHLNMICGKSAQVWQVDQYNILTVGAIPSAVSRLLVSTSPVARTIANDVTTVWLKYTSSDDGQGNTTYGLTDAFSQDDIDRHGPTEIYADLSSAGVMSSGSAAAVGVKVLARYQRAAFAGPFTVRFGQYLTTGGTPVDLGCERAGTVARLLVSDAPFGGEQVTGLIEFVVGAYSYSDDTQTAQITPLTSARSDFASLLALIAPGGN